MGDDVQASHFLVLSSSVTQYPNPASILFLGAWAQLSPQCCPQHEPTVEAVAYLFHSGAASLTVDALDRDDPSK